MPEDVTLPTDEVISGIGDALLAGANEGVDKLQQLQRATSNLNADLEAKLEVLEGLIDSVRNTLGIGEAAVQDEAEQALGEMSAIRDVIAKHAAGVLEDSDLVLVGKINSVPGEFDQSLENADAELKEKFQEVEELLTEQSETLFSASEDVRARADEVSSALEEAGSDLSEHLSEAMTSLEELFDLYETASNGGTSALIEAIGNRVSEEINTKIEDAGGEVLASFDKLTEAVDDLFGGASKSLNDINDVCEDIVEIVEPVMPILEGISAIT
ncbi:hypothetical protein [Ruegeria arenilitoris]|uniref:hypothetical protein n=1 Tax=Ruegeria arenilitoris TaxID=1173585 RepID=UPI001480EA0F|nr:hypothetical protein [Ruegeria arenilitoris]